MECHSPRTPLPTVKEVVLLTTVAGGSRTQGPSKIEVRQESVVSMGALSERGRDNGVYEKRTASVVCGEPRMRGAALPGLHVRSS